MWLLNSVSLSTSLYLYMIIECMIIETIFIGIFFHSFYGRDGEKNEEIALVGNFL